LFFISVGIECACKFNGLLKRTAIRIVNTFLMYENEVLKDCDYDDALVTYFNSRIQRKDYLDDCFQSVISQCDENIEIIALDDQSTDGSFEYLQ